MTGLLRYPRQSHRGLADNARHIFAAEHTLVAYSSGAVFTYIPKNACTTLRYSLAIANGVLTGPKDFSWIHDNNQTFAASLPDLIRADISVVILRCPYQRLASVFLDKFASYDPMAWGLLHAVKVPYGLPDLTFRKFVDLLDGGHSRRNHHWRPQVDFLVYENYSHWIGLSVLSKTAAEIEATTGVAFQDTRELMGHDLGRFELIDGAFADTPLVEVNALMREGKAPKHSALYDGDIVAAVSKMYREDLDLVREKCGEEEVRRPG